jgi:HK97 family phage prohead protease
MTVQLLTRIEAANAQRGMELRDVWSAAMVNDLPDSSFLLIESGGTKDSEGKTTPRSLRHFPVKDAGGKVDLPHLRNALARIPQASSLTPAQRASAMDKAKAMAKSTSVGGPSGSYSGSAGSGRSKMPAEAMQTRTYDLALELRADGDGRTLLGRAVPYDQTAEIPGGKERFVLGAFARQIAGGNVGAVKMHSSHTSRLAGEFPVGKTVSLAEQPDGLHGAWRLYDTPRGDEALHMVRTGEVTGLSIGFKASDGGTKRGADGAYERLAAHLDHVVLTGEPAYAGAMVTAVRSAGHPIGGYRTFGMQAHHLLEQLRS